MKHQLEILGRYLQYYFKARPQKGHGVHSPFVFDFITRVLNDRTKYPEYAKVEELRKTLQKDSHLLEVLDLGAGSHSGDQKQRRVSEIARNAAKPAKFGQLLFRMVRYYQPRQILELGTSLGITTSYLASARDRSTVVTLEGAPTIAREAVRNFEKLSLYNIDSVEGNFDQVLPGVLEEMGRVDLVFVDGNHRKQPTLDYFEQLMQYTGEDTILIFDDIHWSREMEEAWDQIRRDDRVPCSIDLFFIGILFFKSSFREKIHQAIRF